MQGFPIQKKKKKSTAIIDGSRFLDSHMKTLNDPR